MAHPVSCLTHSLCKSWWFFSYSFFADFRSKLHLTNRITFPCFSFLKEYTIQASDVLHEPRPRSKDVCDLSGCDSLKMCLKDKILSELPPLHNDAFSCKFFLFIFSQRSAILFSEIIPFFFLHFFKFKENWQSEIAERVFFGWYYSLC